MSWTAPEVAEQEYHETYSVVEEKAGQLADQIRKSNHFIAFTGAGISTSAGIPDFRGPDGQWTLMAQGRQRTSQTIDTMQAIPTPTHMALVELQNRGILKYLISQNYDGLHRRSGILPHMISELHGNSNREYCKNCGKDYIRDFHAVATYAHSINDHRTGRKCGRCGAALHDSIINFGENLPVEELRLAFDHAWKADICLVLGSSLLVAPASELPALVGRKPDAVLAICNLQKTPSDETSKLRIFSEADFLMTKLMEKLDIPIPPFILHRCLVIRLELDQHGHHQLSATGVDSDGTPVSFLLSVKLPQYRRVAQEEPFVVKLRGDLATGTQITVGLQFMGHYNEPDLALTNLYKGGEVHETMYFLAYDPRDSTWSTRSHDIPSQSASNN
ncbi:NAD-dependent protein deacetylase SRT1 [Paramyrothecium foliicola]|nr:NAD-dependent protein deacetylase SRT1 [Paramyrothecium foliicola]